MARKINHEFRVGNKIEAPDGFNEDEAALLAAHRRDVAKVMGLDVKYTTAHEVIARYTELMALKNAKAAKKAA